MSAFTDAAGLGAAFPLAPASTQPLGNSLSFDDAVQSARTSTGSYNTPQPAVNPTVGGFLSNLYHGFTDMVDGIVGIGKMGIHDVIGGVEQVIPGQQSLETEIEKNGYQIATMAKAMPAALKADYSQRYGGVSNIIRGLYENPLAYISDALMVAGGAGAIAKVGRAGAFASKIPFTLMPEGAAEAVLGAGAETGYRALAKVATTSIQEAPKTFALSRNPLTRVVQQKLVGLASLDADAATKLLSVIPEAEQPRLSNTIAMARANNIPILKPYLVKGVNYNPVETITKFWANKAITSKAMEIRAQADAVGTKYHNIIGQAHEMDLAQVDAGIKPELTLSNESTMDVISGDRQRVPLHLPSNAGMAVVHDLPIVEDGVLPAAQFAVDPATGNPITSAMDNVMDAAEAEGFRPGQLVDGEPDRYMAEQAGGTAGTHEPKVTVYAGTMDDAPGMVQRLAERTGMTVEGVVDTTSDPAVQMVEFTAALRNADGSLVHVSVATPRMARAQVAATHILDQTNMARSQAAQLMAEAARIAEEGGSAKMAMAMADDAATFLRDATAGDKLAQHIFDVARREYHASRSGVPYDPNLWAADAMAAEHYLDITKPWLESGVGGKAPYARHMAHAFLPQRVRQYLNWEAQVFPKIKAVMATSPDNASAYADLVQVLGEQSGLPNALIEDILGNAPWLKDSGKAANRLMQRARRNLWEHVVTEGDRGAEFGFPEYDWQNMYREFAEAGIPTPNYYPAMSVRKLSDYAMAGGGRVSLRGASAGRFARKAKGALWETMNVDTNIEDIYTKVAGFYRRSQEVNSLVTALTERYGRKLTQAEAQSWNPIEHLHEEAVSLKTLQHQLGVQASMHGDTLSNIALGMDTGTAINEAFKGVLDSVVEGGLDQMLGDVVVMPKSVMRALRAQTAYQLGAGSSWLRGYNSLMSMWKQAVLSLRPTWLINNMGGNSFFTLFKDPAAFRHLWHTGNLRTELDSYAERLMRVYLGYDTSKIVGSGFFGTMKTHEFEDLSRQTQGTVAEALERNTWYTNVKQGLGRLTGKSYRMNSMVEQGARRGVFVSEAAKEVGLPNYVRAYHDTETLIKKIMSEGADSRSLATAAEKVNKVLGDYETFGPAEQYIVRQFMFPFYSFWRHAVKFLVKMPFENPYKSSMLRQIGLMDQQMYADWPDYLRSRVRLGELGGKDLMLGLRGMNPLSFASDAMPILSNLNPLLKIGIERNIGINTYTGESFEDPGTVFEDHSGQKWIIEKDGNGIPIGVHRVQGVVAPSWLQHVGSMLPQLTFIPSFSLYPRSLTLNLANYLGAPVSSTDLGTTVAYNQQAEIDAQSQMFNEAMKS